MSNEMIAWSFYYAGACLMGVFGWRITRGLSRYARWVLMVSYVVLFFTPFSLNLADKPDAYAPALFIAALNSMFQDADAGLDAAITLAMIWMTALIVTLIVLLIAGRRRPAPKAQHTHAKTP